jgi:hypothetical protein
MKLQVMALAGLLVVVGGGAPAQTAPADAGREKLAQFIGLGFKDGRDRLHSGVYRARGRKVDDSAETGKLEGPVDIFCAFDYRNELLRFDRVEVDRVFPVGAEEGQKTAWVAEPVGGKYARTPKKSFHVAHGDKNPSITVHDPQYSPLTGVQPIDIRTLGLCYANDLESSFQETYKSLTLQAPDEIGKDAKGMYRLRIEYDEGLAQYVVWLDEAKGFVPVRMERAERNEPGERWEQRCVSEVSWVEKGQAWVPKSYRIVDQIVPGRTMTYELAFDWESVNEPIPEKLFTPEGFGLPKGALIINEELSKPFIEGVIGGGPVRAILADAEPPPPPKEEKSTVWIAILGMVLLGAASVYGFGWYHFRRRSQARRATP